MVDCVTTLANVSTLGTHRCLCCLSSPVCVWINCSGNKAALRNCFCGECTTRTDTNQPTFSTACSPLERRKIYIFLYYCDGYSLLRSTDPFKRLIWRYFRCILQWQLGLFDKHRIRVGKMAYHQLFGHFAPGNDLAWPLMTFHFYGELISCGRLAGTMEGNILLIAMTISKIQFPIMSRR